VLVPNNREDAATRLIVGLDAWSVLRVFVVKIVEASEVFRDVVSQLPTRDHLVCYIKDEDVRCQDLADSAARMRSSRRGVKKGQPGHGQWPLLGINPPLLRFTAFSQSVYGERIS
jgi:hypothetical protein